MFKDAFDFLFKEFSWGKLAFLIGVLILLTFGAWIYESYTGSFRLGRIEKSIKLAKELGGLSDNEAFKKNKELSAISQGIVRELDEYVNKPTTVSITPEMKKGFAAAAPWIVLFLYFLLKKDVDVASTLGGIVIFTIPVVFVGIMLPNFNQSWINYYGYPLTVFVVFTVLVTVQQRRKRRTG